MPLSDTQIRNLKPDAKRVVISDTIVPGLKIQVTPNGAKTFLLVKRLDPKASGATPLVLGRLGTIGLGEARNKARRCHRHRGHSDSDFCQNSEGADDSI